MLRPDVAVPNGLTLIIDNQAPRHLGPIDSLNLSLAAGTHTLAFTGVPASCTIHDPNPQNVLISADSVSVALFGGSC